ncbi:MAG: hypothetical protein JJU29_01810 [Verrucomicrobia bacterium]|nr:hypothetical protein [Verrucomicrobiota bacterium]MCH8510969.1 hypothetical protein [Kiritimatiellia bacterium]
MHAVKLGIEIEYLMTDSKGLGVRSGYKKDEDPPRTLGLKVLRDAALAIEPGIGRQRDPHGHVNVYAFQNGVMRGTKMLPDTFSLVETVTAPSANLDLLRDQLWTMKKALIEAAGRHGCSISGAACPVGYAYEEFSSHRGATCNNAGMHIHFDAEDDRDKIKLANIITQVIPELTALSVNSPIYARKPQDTNSYRLKSSRLISAEQVRTYRYVEGQRLVPENDDHDAARCQFVTPFTKTGCTVELRGFDCPMTIDWAMGIAALVQCLATKAKRLFIDEKRNTIVSGKKIYRQKNFERALAKGLGAKFIVDPTFHMSRGLGDNNQSSTAMHFLHHTPDAAPFHETGTNPLEIPAVLALKRLLYYIEPEAVGLGVMPYLEPVFKAVAEGCGQADLQRKWFATHDLSGFRKQIDSVAAAAPQGVTGRVPGHARYVTVRQKRKPQSDSAVYMNRETAEHLGVEVDEAIQLTGPLGNAVLTVKMDSVSESTLSLAKEEVRVCAYVRRQLGISLFDPALISDPGGTGCVSLVVRKCGTDCWQPEPASSVASNVDTRPVYRDDVSVPLTIVRGFRAHGEGTVALGEKTASALQLIDGDLVSLTHPESARSLTLAAVADSRLLRGVAALMESDRKMLGVGLGDVINLHKE